MYPYGTGSDLLLVEDKYTVPPYSGVQPEFYEGNSALPEKFFPFMIHGKDKDSMFLTNECPNGWDMF